MNPLVPIAGGAAVLFALYEWRKGKATPADGLTAEPAPAAVLTLVPDFGGRLGKELQRAKDNGWDVLFAASETAHGLPPGILSAIASRETNSKNIVGDMGHGRGLMQIDDRSHGAWLRSHGAGDVGAPDVDAAIDFAGGLVASAIAYARFHGVAEEDVLKFALSSYNAGEGGALSGYHAGGDSDLRTTGKDYGRDVLRRWHDMYPAQGDPVLTPLVVAGWSIGAVSDRAALSPAISTLLQQIDTIWPSRSTASDGTTEDTDEPDHMAGNGVDITNDPTHGPALWRLAEILLSDPRTHYVIFDSRIANRDYQAGAWRPYPERLPDETDGAYEARAKLYNKHSRHLHLSVRASGRDDGSMWPKGAKDNAQLGSAAPEIPAPPAASVDRLPDLLRQGVSKLWDDGLIDNFRWVPLTIGPYELQVTADAISAYGLRLPVTFSDVLHMAAIGDILPPTKAIVDARWAAANRHLVEEPIGGGAFSADGKNAKGVQQVQEWDARLPPISPGPLYDGAWKEWILEPGIALGQAVNYGLRRADGSVWQSPGHHHDDRWSDYSQFATFVKRHAKKNGQPVDLLEELRTAGPLGGPIPQWIADRVTASQLQGSP